MAFPFPQGNFLNLHGRLIGLFRGLMSAGDAWLGGDGFAGILGSVNDNLTAGIGGGTANAVKLTSAISRFTTVTSANDSCMLPPAVLGMQITVINDASANSLQLFGNLATLDTIDGVANATGNAMAAAKRVDFVAMNTALPASGTQAAVPGRWISNAGAKTG